MKTKIFCDSADYKTIKKLSSNPLVGGFTTNPSLMRLAGAKNYKNYSLKLLKVCKNKPISFEVFADEFNAMEKQAYKINSWGKNIYVKIPVINSKGIFTGRIINKLSKKGINLNITAVYTPSQIRKILKNISNNSKIIISIFAGRMGDAGKDPIPIIKEGVKLTKKMKKGIIQANGLIQKEPVFKTKHVAKTIHYIAELPLDVNVQFITLMATKMPFIGRG